ncbi:hypothetical protein L596_024023 [Steinernema carpocapsae]|uniref:GYF domain-containing protein n=1 Tax=Steinernema carpocapsae TaxID=34508 RepID=A0A4V5ZZK7_STECR|nr:hypothetical protein L596_024023 [Steinernema carpocapsae]
MLQQNETVEWYILTPTGPAGPYSPANMCQFTSAGAITGNTYIKTAFDQEFYTLQDYTGVIGCSPFLVTISSSFHDMLAYKNTMTRTPWSGLIPCQSVPIQSMPMSSAQNLPSGMMYSTSFPGYNCVSPSTTSVMTVVEPPTDSESLYSISPYPDPNRNMQTTFRVIPKSVDSKNSVVPGKNGVKAKEKEVSREYSSCEIQTTPVKILHTHAEAVLSEFMGIPVVICPEN